MPMMAAHNEHSSNYSSPSNSVFINNVNYSPESPPSTNSRKRKQQQQQEFQFGDLNQQSGNSNNGVLDSFYQTYNQPWNGNHSSSDNFIIPVTSSSTASSTTIAATIFHNSNSNITSEDNDLIINKLSHMMNNSWHRSTSSNDPFLVNTTNYDNHNQDSFIINNQKCSTGVGANTETHQIVNLDQPQQQPFNFVDNSKDASNNAINTRTLHLHDLGSQRLIHQAWPPQNQQSFNNGPNSPGFFTPGFLESLQEDEHESPESFPFHVTTTSTSSSSTARNWALQHPEDAASKAVLTMEHDTIMVRATNKFYVHTAFFLIFFPD
jgi:hypothetical protein